MSEYKYEEKEMSEKVLGFICGCAMHDAIMQQAFKGKKAWIGKEIAKLTENHAYSKYVYSVLSGDFKDKGQENHDRVFNETAREICGTINKANPTDKETFSFGNAQKLINMTIKHLYSICLFDSRLRENFRFCHCPMDSIMLDKVWKKYKKYGNKKRQELLGGTSDTFHKSWGNENWSESNTTQCPERYRKFQEAVRDIVGKDVYPIEYDYIVWGE